MSTTTKTVTAEELFAMGDIGRCELIRGEIVRMAPPSPEHADVANLVAFHLTLHVQANKLGKVFAEVGYVLSRNPDVVRAPDVSFVRADRLPAKFAKGFFAVTPDLAVEVVSPNDTASEVAEKVDEWLAAGVVSVWVIYPTNHSIVIHRSGNQILRYRDSDTITTEPTLAGFQFPVRAIFER
jgi:Uma2 family endonuclease